MPSESRALIALVRYEVGRLKAKCGVADAQLSSKINVLSLTGSSFMPEIHGGSSETDEVSIPKG
jgi:hypothetical protein